MFALRLVLLALIVSAGGLQAQGAGSEEARREEAAALNHARRMKAAKEQAVFEPAPQDLAAHSGRDSAVKISGAQLSPAAEPFAFQVVTPQGLVPLEEWREREAQQAASAAEVPKPKAQPKTKTSSLAPLEDRPPGRPPQSAGSSPKTKTIRLAFLSLGERGAVKPEGRAEPLASSATPKVASAPVSTVAAPPKATPDPKPAAVPTAEVSPAPRPAEMVAVMEELPSPQPGGAPKRSLLGFLSGKGLETALGTAPVPPANEVVQAPAPQVGSPGGVATSSQAGSPVLPEKPVAPGEVTSVLKEESRREALPSLDREEFFDGLGQWLASPKKEAFQPAWVPPKFAGTPASKPVPAAPDSKKIKAAEPPVGPSNPDFYTVKARAPFHVIDTGAGQTHLLELETGTVGRKHGEGDEWAWMQLDSGLMGLVKKRFVRPSIEPEVVAFLAAEAKVEGALASSRSEQPIRVVDVQVPEASSEQAKMEQLLNEGLLPRESSQEMTDPTVMPTQALSEAAVSNPIAAEVGDPGKVPSVGTMPQALPPLPREGGGVAGVIAVPSPVPILP